MPLNSYKNIKFEKIIILIAVLLSVIISIYNLNKFDKIKLKYNGDHFNRLLYQDLDNLWHTADKIREKLENGKSFTEALPQYEKWFLPSIIIGYYYYIIDKEIYQEIEGGNVDKVIKEKNFKFPILLFQIFLYYFSLTLFFKEVKKNINKKTYNVLVLFLCLEPSLLQWHSSFWSESLFLSLMILIFYLLIKREKKFIHFFLIGILVGLMYAQRAVSIYYIIPIIIYFIIEYKKKIFYYFFLIIGYFVILIPIGFVNLNKTDNFHFFSKLHQYYSFYHYFSADILADRMNLTKDKAQKILDNSERKWMKKNNIDLKNPSDFSRNVKYRNKIFLEEVVKNPIYVLKKFTKRVIVMCIIDPIAVQHSFHIDKTHPEAISNPKKYYNKDLYKKIPYALFIEIVSIIGFLFFIKKIVKVKKITSYDKFLIFNLISILYFIIVSGFWGNPKYFTPCVLSLSLFFSHGFYELERRFITKK